VGAVGNAFEDLDSVVLGAANLSERGFGGDEGDVRRARD
jgi:hypothetical protein